MITIPIFLLSEANVSLLAIYFSATEEEVKSSNEDPDDTVSLIDKEGYLGTIGVYHGLHCMVSRLNLPYETNTDKITAKIILAPSRGYIFP
jgi:hypothetical protein